MKGAIDLPPLPLVREFTDAFSPALLLILLASGLLSLFWDAPQYRGLGFPRDERVARTIGWSFVLGAVLLGLAVMVLNYFAVG